MAKYINCLLSPVTVSFYFSSIVKVQTVHTHRASVHQAAKLLAALLMVAGVTAGLAESNGNLRLGL